MGRILEVLGVALAAVRARPMRAALMAAGPFLGVAVIVGAFGVLQSTTGQLRAALERLGSNLIIVEADPATPLPIEAIERVRRVPTVTGASGFAGLSGVTVLPVNLQDARLEPIANQVLATDPDLLAVFEVGVAMGRSLIPADEAAQTTAAVVGAQVARTLQLDFSRPQTIYLNGYPFGVVGALEESILYRPLDFAVLIPKSTAGRIFATDARPSTLLVRVQDGTSRATAPLLARVITYGGPGVPQVTIPADLLAAQTEIDRTLAGAIWALGVLTIAVGGFGIANVMLISVLERRREIGVRRALGHLRSVIAFQFLTEAALVGLIGALVGAAAGVTFALLMARASGWVAVLDPIVVSGAIATAVLVSILAGLYPAIRAARSQPLEALRAD